MKMNRIQLAKDLSLSGIVHGQMRLKAWNLSAPGLVQFTEEMIQLGVTTFDHADIYGNYSCEALFGEALKLEKSLRSKIEIITKCGIKLVSDKFPGRRIKHYEYSYDYIVSSVNNSLRNFNTDRIDLLLLHRPAPFFDPSEVARAFSVLKRDGKVLHFGVSNFSPAQFEMLNSFAGEKLLTNQVEISPYCLEHFENGNMDFFVKEKIRPMAWSPLAGGKLLDPNDEKGRRISEVLLEVAGELNISSIDTVIYAWLLKHPVSIIPVVGSGRIERVKHAIEALDVNMSLEQWYRIFITVKGSELP